MNIAPPLDSRVVALILFGSWARGDADSRSDVDICAIADVQTFEEEQDVLDRLNSQYATLNADFTVLTRDRARAMASKGSVLMMHLKAEGRIIYDKGAMAAHIVGDSLPAKSFATLISPYRRIWNDIASELRFFATLTEADLHSVFMVVRNVCMITALANGQMAFGRVHVFEAAATLPGFPLSRSLYEALSHWSARYSRGSTEPPPAIVLSTLTPSVDELLQFAESVV
jgi:predicted nucleotidyltransferase